MHAMSRRQLDYILSIVSFSSSSPSSSLSWNGEGTNREGRLEEKLPDDDDDDHGYARKKNRG